MKNMTRIGLALLLGLWVGLSACGDVGNTAAPATLSDPSRSLSPREVVDIYVADYTKGDYAHAHWLFSAAIRASNTVDDETRSARQDIAQYGPILAGQVLTFEPQGSEYVALVRFDHRDPHGFRQYALRLRQDAGAWKIAIFMQV